MVPPRQCWSNYSLPGSAPPRSRSFITSARGGLEACCRPPHSRSWLTAEICIMDYIIRFLSRFSLSSSEFFLCRRQKAQTFADDPASVFRRFCAERNSQARSLIEGTLTYIALGRRSRPRHHASSRRTQASLRRFRHTHEVGCR